MRARGQATVELALGAIVFVGVLLIGIHLAEYSQLSLKVQEAEVAAVWEATHHRVQSRAVNGGTGEGPFQELFDSQSGVGPRTERRFEDFDGLSTVNGGNVIGRALTRGTKMKVECLRDDSFHFVASDTARPVLHDVGGIRCQASASIEAIRIPKGFLQADEGGFFKERIFRTAPIPVCGMGLPVNGQCRGSLSVMMNDWGLVGHETDSCVSDCKSPYSGMISKLFTNGGGAGALLATDFAGSAPDSAATFRFDYAGMDYTESPMMHTRATLAGTVPFYTGGAGEGGDRMVSRTSRPGCFLGKCP